MDVLSEGIAAGFSAGSTELVVLAAAAFLTAMLSAVVGMAGGITLLAVMLLFLEPLVAIPLHGVVQLVSNSSRAVVQRQHLRWDIIARYGVLLLPMGFIGLALARSLPPSAGRALIGGFVLLATWLPDRFRRRARPGSGSPRFRFLLLGGAAGLLNPSIGATGPLIAPFFLDLGLSRFAIVGTKAACQTLGHLAKIAVFGLAGFAFSQHAPLLGLLSLLVIAGTRLGSRLLHRVDERAFTLLYKIVLTAIAAHLLLRGLLRWI